MEQAIHKANSRLVWKLVLVVIAAGGLGFAMVPLYDVLCKITGLNGKTAGVVSGGTAPAAKIDRTRWITVEFAGNAMQGLSWEFGARQNRLKVNPGEIVTVTFYARNPTNQTLTGQAIPSVSPGWVAQYFNKLDCFCFKHQQLKSGESREMRLTFFVSPDLPKNVRDIALSYAFFPIVKGS